MLRFVDCSQKLCSSPWSNDRSLLTDYR